jgi:hypothetical protein
MNAIMHYTPAGHGKYSFNEHQGLLKYELFADSVLFKRGNLPKGLGYIPYRLRPGEPVFLE